MRVRAIRPVTQVAVIGIGRWGRRLIQVLDGFGVLGLCCNRGDPAGQAWVHSEYPNVRVGSAAEDAIGDPTIDCIVIATPIASHAPLVGAALEAGKHVFVEKPLATTADDAWRLVATAERVDRRLFVGHTFLFEAGLEQLRELITDDPVREASFGWWKRGTFDEALIWNLLPHEVSLAIWFGGGLPATVAVLEQAAGQTSLDRLRLRLGFGAGGPDCEIEIDRMSAIRTKTARIVTRSGLAYLWRDGNLYVEQQEGVVKHISGPSEETLRREVRAFIETVESGRPNRSDGRFGAQVVEVIERVAHALSPAGGALPQAGVLR